MWKRVMGRLVMFPVFHILLVSWLFVEIEALKCMTCYGATSFEDCDGNGHIKECMPNENSCETAIRRINKEHQLIFKQCKDKRACEANQLQNTRLSGKSAQCNSDQTSSLCTCCCDTEMCNIASPTCHPSIVKPSSGKSCPEHPKLMHHGKITCFNDNKPGSVCQYQCSDEDYFVYPANHETNVCLNNGTWKHETPCCGRSCPPYFVYDFVDLLYVSIPEGRRRLYATFEGLLSVEVVADDAVKGSFVFFGETPIESSAVKFNDYGAEADRFLRLLREQSVEQPEAVVNIGAAIQYALENLLTPEAGMRDGRVQKAIAVFTDRNSDDDAVGPANEARKRGYLVLVFYMGKVESDFDQTPLNEIAGSKDMVFLYDEATENFGADSWQFVTETFCTKPCDHVVHEHDTSL